MGGAVDVRVDHRGESTPGQDEGPNPAELALHALGSLLTTTLVYVAAAREVTLTRVTSHLEGDLDVRGADLPALRGHLMRLSDAMRTETAELQRRSVQPA